MEMKIEIKFQVQLWNLNENLNQDANRLLECYYVSIRPFGLSI